jgi:hypothetical protein
MPGFDSRIQVYAFLKEDGVLLQYGISDLERDRKMAERRAQRVAIQHPLSNTVRDDRCSSHVSSQLSNPH